MITTQNSPRHEDLAAPAGTGDALPSPTATPGAAGVLNVAATFVAEPLERPISWLLQQLRINRTLRFAPYNQVFQQLLAPSSALANADGPSILLIRLEDFARDQPDPDTARLAIQKIGAELSEVIEQFVASHGRTLIVVLLPVSPRVPPTLVDETAKAVEHLAGSVSRLKGVHLITESNEPSIQCTAGYDRISDDLAHIPYSASYYSTLALVIARRIHALCKPRAKVLALDCDNTLWRGVVGEDGVDGIALSEPFLAVQDFAIAQQSKGVLLCLVSKNVESDVLELFARRKDMRLNMEHVVSHRVNWSSKSSNLASLATELNLGLDSFVFIDDNPVECLEMRAALPEVVTLQLPTENAISSFLKNLWMFDTESTTTEDSNRTRMYKDNTARKALEASSQDMRQFIAALELTIDIAAPAEEEWARIEQLTQRTNQFNFTTRRRSQQQLRAFVAADTRILRVRVADRFGDYGLVGVIVASADGASDALVVDTFLLSCRVLGRGVEHAMLRALADCAKAFGLHTISVPYLETARNVPARAFADSVAGQFAQPIQGGRLYLIPTAFAATIQQKPGEDPIEVMEALRSEDRKSAVSAAQDSAGPLSEIYASLALDLTSGSELVKRLSDGRRSRHAHSAPALPNSDGERRMIAIMEEVLEIEGLGAEDDFFELGGTSIQSVALFAQIERQFGKQLRLTAILQAPTARKLAALVGLSQSPVRDSIVSLRPGSERSLFLVHDGLGETLLYLHLAKNLPSSISVYGIEPMRQVGVSLAHESIEDMAAQYAEQILRKDPTGPFLLGGMCAGGTIAYAVATNLTRAGHKVALVVIMDGATPQAPKRTGRLARRRVEGLQSAFKAENDISGSGARSRGSLVRWISTFRTLASKTRNVVAYESMAFLQRLGLRAKFQLLKLLLRYGRNWPNWLSPPSVMQLYSALEARYTPAPLPGVPVLLVKATSGVDNDTPYKDRYRDDDLGWRVVAPQIDIVDVPGGHSSMLQEHEAAGIAAEIERRLR